VSGLLTTDDVPTTQRAMTAPGEVIIIRAAGTYEGKQGMSLATGVSSRSAGARALCLHLVTIPPGTPDVPHLHDGHESAIYIVSGQTEVWRGSARWSRPATSSTSRRAPRTCPSTAAT
jgi:uncharacterized RmlC-like cupin family protein